MSERSSISIIKGISMKSTMIFILALLPLHFLLAQDEVIKVQNMRKSTYSSLNVDLYAFCRFSFLGNKVNTSIINFQTDIDKKIHQQFLNAGCEIDFYRKQAKENAQKDKQDWADTINMYRKSGYEDDMKTNATYASIICLVLCVLGRYLVKLTKWVDKNKTK